MWVDRVAAVGPGSARSHAAAFVMGGCATLPSDVGAAVHAGPLELDVFAGIRDDGVGWILRWPRRTRNRVREMFLQIRVCRLAIWDR